MDGLAVMQVSGVVVALMYLLRWAGIPNRWAPLLVPTLSALGVGLWAYANAPIGRVETFSYVAGWIAVAMSAATVWGFAWAAAGSVNRPARGTGEPSQQQARESD
jgi:hypothetical protein